MRLKATIKEKAVQEAAEAAYRHTLTAFEPEAEEEWEEWEERGGGASHVATSKMRHSSKYVSDPVINLKVLLT
jgi:hypothetical protein